MIESMIVAIVTFFILAYLHKRYVLKHLNKRGDDNKPISQGHTN